MVGSESVHVLFSTPQRAQQRRGLVYKQLPLGVLHREQCVIGLREAMSVKETELVVLGRGSNNFVQEVLSSGMAARRLWPSTLPMPAATRPTTWRCADQFPLS
jgi:hypothetical protein